MIRETLIHPPMSSRIDDCREIELPAVADLRGTLTFAEAQRHVPFEIKRVFYIYGVPAGKSRGAHAHKKLHQLLICLTGSLDVEVDDARSKALVHLDRPSKGLYVPPLIWASLINFAPGTICLVLTSDYYDERDHVRDYPLFLALGKGSDRTLP
jgi:dTDP-4-dehydrorhamnose 3,5-epimerase-like enzyme